MNNFHNLLEIVLVIIGVVAGLLFVVIAPLMTVLVIRGIRDELDLRKSQKSMTKTHVGAHRRKKTMIEKIKGLLFLFVVPFITRGLRDKLAVKRNQKNVQPIGAHRAETPKERAQRELRELKEYEARKASFFSDYWLHGDISGLGRPEAPHPAYNLITTGVQQALREMDEVNDSKIMQVATEGI